MKLRSNSRFVGRILTSALVAAVAVAIAGGLLGFLAYRVEPYTARQVTLYRYSRLSTYDAYFTLRHYTEIYGSSILPVNTSLPVYLSLVEGINVSYSYRVEGADPSGSVRIEVILKHPDGWSYRYADISEGFKGRFSTSYYIDMGKTVEIMDGLCKEVGQRLYSFTLQVNTYFDHLTEVRTGSRKDHGNHTLTFSIDVTRNRVQLVSGNLRYAEPVEEKTTIYDKQYVFGLEVPTLRTLSATAVSVGTISAAILALLHTSKSAGAQPMKSFERKYRDLIVEVAHIEGNNPVEVRVASPEGLVKLARLIETPILKSSSRYVVVSKSVTYYYEETTNLSQP